MTFVIIADSIDLSVGVIVTLAALAVARIARTARSGGGGGGGGTAGLPGRPAIRPPERADCGERQGSDLHRHTGSHGRLSRHRRVLYARHIDFERRRVFPRHLFRPASRHSAIGAGRLPDGHQGLLHQDLSVLAARTSVQKGRAAPGRRFEGPCCPGGNTALRRVPPGQVARCGRSSVRSSSDKRSEAVWA